MTQVVTLETARKQRDQILNEVEKILGPALIKEREQNEMRQQRIELLMTNIARLGQENDQLKAEKQQMITGGVNKEDIKDLQKRYKRIIYEDVKDTLDPKTRSLAEKYIL
jgi:hypothetical protein